MIRRAVMCGVLWVLISGCEKVDDESDAVFREGMRYFRAGSWSEAEAQFKRVLQIAPDSLSAMVRLSEIYLETSRKEPARRIFEQLPAAFLQRPAALVLQARMLASQSRIAEAWDLSESVLEQFPADVDARLHLAQLCLGAGVTMDLERARALCLEVLERVPREPRAGVMLLRATLRLGHFGEVAELGERFSRQHPRHRAIPLLMGTAAVWQGEPASVALLRRAVDLSLDHREERLYALWLLKLVYDRQGGYPPELEDRYRMAVTTQTPQGRGNLRFTDVGKQAGVDRLDRGRGSSWLDFDGDGDLDIFTVGIQSPHSLYRNDGDGRFQDVAAATGLADPRGGWGASRADFDNDGDPDLYVTRDAWEGKAPNSLYRNELGLFTDIAVSVGAADSGSSFTATWADFDVDGNVDLYVANGVVGDGGKNSLLLNRNGVKFSNVADDAGVSDPGKSLGTASGDYDADGLPDIFVVNIGQPNRLYHNEGSAVFRDRAAAAGVVFPIEGGYVTTFLDYDNDGSVDLFAATMSGFGAVLAAVNTDQSSGLNRPFLYHNEGDGTFVDVSTSAGLDRPFGTMGIGVGDVDNDGYPDLYLANGGPEMFRWEPNTLFLNQSDGTFVDVTAAANVGNLGAGHGATFGDFDADGDVDLYAGLGGHYDGDLWPNSLYRNDLEGGNFLAVEVVGTASNRDGIGTSVTLFSGSHQVHAVVSSGFGFGSSNDLRLHLGLGELAAADRLEIRWPSGRIQVFVNPPVNCVIRVTEGEAVHEVVKWIPR